MFETLKQLLKTKKYIITNTDIDGILSAIVLTHFFKHLEIGGFTNSDKKIWLHDDVNKENSVYLDIFMANKNILSIDNHIISMNTKTVFNDNKINPNIIRNRSLEEYWKKYPFSTFLFIIYILETMDFHYNIDINKIIGNYNGNNVYLWELLLRADDSMLSTFKYSKNSADWWDFLIKNKKDENNILYNLYKKINYDVKTTEKAIFLKNKINKFLKENFQNIDNDGYKNIDKNREDFYSFFKFINHVCNENLKFPKHLKTYTLNSNRINIHKDWDINEIKETIVSLAFINKNTLSFTFK